MNDKVRNINGKKMDQTRVASADEIAKDVAIKAMMEFSFAAFGACILDVTDQAIKANMMEIPTGMIMSLLANACGLAKANGYTMQTVALALGQAWNAVDVNSNDVHGGECASDKEPPKAS